ncbi:MAG: hypothetical protein NC410_06290 [Oscillibacter sp.]|nr:hypothetical protein [Oscillibacter sp.]
MNQEENTNPVVLNGEPSIEQTPCTENAELRKYYFHQQLLINPNVDAKLSDNAWIISFKRRAERFAEMLAFLERSWVEDVPVLQKACFSYLTEDNIPRKERQRIIEAWTNWADFQFSLNRYRALASFFLKYQRRMLQELESLLPPATPESASESQTTNQEGGI